MRLAGSSDPVMRSVDPRDRALPTDGSRQSTASDSPRASRHAPACSTTSKLTTIETACTRRWAISAQLSSNRPTLLNRVSEIRGQDQLTFDVKPEGATEWQGQRAFHFDITAGFNALQARLNSATPTIDTQSHNRKTPITPTT